MSGAADAGIVDAQIHIGPGGIAETLAAMDALGIAAVLVDEYWLRDFTGKPHAALPGGARRPLCPTAQLAALQHPERFAWLLRIDRHDPDFAAIIRQVRDAPGGRALRLDPGLDRANRRAFAEGGYDPILAAAADHGLPVFVFAQDDPAGIARAARAFPALRLVADHCGLFSNSMRRSFAGLPERDAAGQMALFEEVLALAALPNVALKWGHASAMFDAPAWPGEALWPVLRRAVDAFGPGRVMWASDFSVNQRGECWADLLYGVKACPLLSAQERADVLGGAVRQWLEWPA